MKTRWKLILALGAGIWLIAVYAGVAVGASNATAIERLWGRDITVRELLLAVSPELLSQIPAAAWNTRVQWGVPSTTAKWAGVPGADGNGEADVRDISDIWVIHDNVFDVWGRTVDFGASSTVTWPPFARMDMMSVFGFLLEDGRIIDTTGETKYDVWRVSALDSRRVDGGARYKNMSYHYVDYPAGYWPPTVFVVLYSWEVWIDE